MDGCTTASQAALDSIGDSLDRAKEAEATALSTCSYCGKRANIALPHCSRCKVASYCNQTCQQTDYKTRHKRECTSFASVPVTRGFLTKPLPGDLYPQHPLFARGHGDGVGCWVTVAGRVDCDMLQLADPMALLSEDDSKAWYKKRSEDLGKMQNARHRNLTSLAVLVQNRRKDGAPIIVYSALSEVVSFPSTTAAIMRGTWPGDNLKTFIEDKVDSAAMGVANDPWDGTPRLNVTHFNGHELSSSDSPFPNAIKNSKQGVIELKPGDFAIIQLQFRVGDGDRLSKDWAGLGCLQRFLIPFTILGSSSTPPTLPAHALPPADERAQHQMEAVVCAKFKQSTVRAFYGEFIDNGQDAYLRSHYGNARASMVGSSEEMMGQQLMQVLETTDRMNMFMDRLRTGRRKQDGPPPTTRTTTCNQSAL